MEKEQAETEAKRRRTQAKYDKEATRYECFCSKQYLSYPALYLHLKNKHQNYFMRTKGGKKVESSNKLVETIDSQEGYKVLKIPLSQASPHELGPHQQVLAQHSYDPFLFHNYYYAPPFYPQAPQDKSFFLRFLPIEKSFTSFLDSLFKTEEAKSSKARVETELLLALLVKCLNENYQLLRDPRTVGKAVERYTAEYGGEYVSRIFAFFDREFVARLRDREEEPYIFFIQNSHIIGSQNYKKILIQLSEFLTNRKPQEEEELVRPEEKEEKSSQKEEFPKNSSSS